MLLTLGIPTKLPLPDLSPLLELDYVTVEEPRKQPEKPPPPQVKQKVHQPLPEPTPQTAIPDETPIELPLEPTPAPAAPVDIPTPPRAAPRPPVDAPQRISTTAVLDNTGFEPLYNPKPDYPVVAQEARITGYVDVDLTIADNGSVKSFSIVTIKGHPAFGIESARVLPRWRFPPPRIGGKKCSVKYLYRINFSLN